MITNLANTTTQQYWMNGHVFLAPFGDSNEPIVDTTTQQLWMDGQTFLYPFQNINQSTNQTRFMIIRTDY